MKQKLTTVAAVAAALALTGLSSIAGAGPAAAATRTIVGQGAYLCQSAPDGLPFETYDITVRMSLEAPASVTPGQTVALSGTATLQFPEKAYQNGKQYGVTEADGYSNTLSVATTTNGRTSDVPANRWQTAPFPWNDPVVISAPITLKPFTVPTDATGSLVITLPRNERRAPNTASDSPATVAFNGVANSKTSAGNVSENLGCYITSSGPSVIGTIPITTSSSSDGSTTGDPSSGSNAAPGTTGDPRTQSSSGQAPGAGGTQSEAPAGAEASLATGAEGVLGTTQTGTPGAGQALSATSPGTTRSGVFIPTNMLILVGGLICIFALGYASLTQYRMRNIKRAMDG